MNSDFTLFNVITLAIAVIGAALGVVNTWKSVNRDKVKLKVVPKKAIPYGISDNRERLCIEVTNLSTFPVTVCEIGILFRGTKNRGALVLPKRTMKKLLSILILFFIIMGCSKTVQPYVTVPFEQGLWGGNLVSTTSNNGVQKVNATGSLGFIFTSRNYQYSGSYYLFATNTTQNDFRWNGQFKKLCDSMVTLVDARDTILTAYAIPTLNLHGNYKYKWDGQMLTIFRTDSLTTVKITLHRLFPE